MSFMDVVDTAFTVFTVAVATLLVIKLGVLVWMVFP